MPILRSVLLVSVALSLSGCSGIVSRGKLHDPARIAASPADAATQYTVTGVTVTVPQTLSVTEDATPPVKGMILWKGEPKGDRRAQVAALFTTAARTATAGMQTGPNALVEAEVTKFHSLTQARNGYTTGIYSAAFVLTLRDPQTGMVLEAPRTIATSFPASGFGGALAHAAPVNEQRSIITKSLADVIRREVSRHVETIPQVGSADTSGLHRPGYFAFLSR